MDKTIKANKDKIHPDIFEHIDYKEDAKIPIYRYNIYVHSKKTGEIKRLFEFKGTYEKAIVHGLIYINSYPKKDYKISGIDRVG